MNKNIKYTTEVKFTGKMTRKILKVMKEWKDINNRCLDRQIKDSLNQF